MTTLATDIMVGTAPPEHAGAAAAISETSSEFGGALGIAVLGSIGTAVYRGHLAENLPAGVPPDAATIARDTLGGAVAAAGQLSHPLDAALITAALEAFARSFELSAAVSAGIALATAIIAVVLLRHVRTDYASGH